MEQYTIAERGKSVGDGSFGGILAYMKLYHVIQNLKKYILKKEMQS